MARKFHIMNIVHVKGTIKAHQCIKCNCVIPANTPIISIAGYYYGKFQKEYHRKYVCMTCYSIYDNSGPSGEKANTTDLKSVDENLVGSSPTSANKIYLAGNKDGK